MWYVFGTVYIICEIGERASEAFEEIDNGIGAIFDWYLFPPQIQKILPLLTMDAQQLVALQCFGSILCNRETFENVRIKQRKFVPFSNFHAQLMILMIEYL